MLTWEKYRTLHEMSIPLKDFRELVGDLRFQLVQNWCLCKYCQLFDSGNLNFSHWETELKSYIMRLKGVSIKNNIDKKRSLEHILGDYYDFNDVEMVKCLIVDKFEDEHVTDERHINAVATTFVNDISELIDILSDKSTHINDYLTHTFHSENCTNDNLIE